MGALLVTGTSSDAGKSVLVAGLCRWLARDGVRVAPFKAQNMSLNSYVTSAGEEIGRAQAAQALACRIEPEAVMNPVLLKPGSDTGSQLIVLGHAAGEHQAAAYWGGLAHGLLDLVVDSFHGLTARFDAVICEGAGSPAEINLRESDIVNLGFARAAGVPALLVGDIDRGGVFASFVGTLAVLDPADQALLAGFVVNKFRGDPALLDPGLAMLEKITGRPTLGVLPFVRDIGVDAEDAIDWELLRSGGRPLGEDVLKVVVVALPRMSNHTDLDALAVEPGVVLKFATQAAELRDADLVVLPGTRATVADLRWLRECGIDAAVQRHAAAGRPVLGICGGYQMLGDVIDDPVESGAGEVAGLGLLPVRTRFGPDKILARPSRLLADGAKVHGYEIHYGVVRRAGADPLFADEGCRAGAVAGTIWHGLLENDAFRRGYLRDVARACGLKFTVAPDTDFSAVREARLDRLADLVADHLDHDAIRRLLDSGSPVAPALQLTLSPAVGPVISPTVGPTASATSSPTAGQQRALLSLPRSTRRLLLRPFRHGDEAAVLAYRGRDDVCRYLPVDPIDAAGARALIEDQMTATQIVADGDRIVLAVEHDGHVIGDVLVRTAKIADKQAEIGWVFNPGWHGHGYATEAARELIQLVFDDLGMHRVWAQLDPQNVPSARVCERLGLRQEAHLREESWFKGRWGDLAIYALLRSQWATGPDDTTGSGAEPTESTVVR